MPDRELPPGQYASTGWPVLHYGRIPRLSGPWDFRVFGATASGVEHVWSAVDFAALPGTVVTADMHCVTRFSVLDNRWGGVPVGAVLEAAPPRQDVTHVMIWAEYGYSANLRLSDFGGPGTLLATHRGGEQLSWEHGYPLRLVVSHLYAWKSVKWLRGVEYLTRDRRGFWEERGYHNIGDPWHEQRYAYQELPGHGPELG